MGKFKIHLELQGLKLEIEGSREDAPMIASNLGRQFSNLLAPAASIVEGDFEVQSTKQIQTPTEPGADGASSKRKRTRRRANGSVSTETADKTPVAIDWSHNVEKFGHPQQAWTTAKKAMWLLWVVGEQTMQVELTRFQIAETFNKHFKTAGLIRPQNVGRDFGTEKTHRPPKVSEDTTQDPSLWFLTEAGKRYARGLVAEALGGNPATDETETSE